MNSSVLDLSLAIVHSMMETFVQDINEIMKFLLTSADEEDPFRKIRGVKSSITNWRLAALSCNMDRICTNSTLMPYFCQNSNPASSIQSTSKNGGRIWRTFCNCL